MRSRIVLAVAVLLLVVAVATVAFAAIPHSSTGVITGCYKNANPNKGSVIVVDAEAGATCPSGYTQLTWNQTGPQGPAGVTNLQSISSQTPSIPPGDFRAVELTCPSGKKVLSGGHQFSASDDLVVIQSAPLDGPTDLTGWVVTVRNDDTTSLVATGWALCATVS